MAVIVREEKYIEGKKYTVKVYKTRPGKLVTDDEKKKAERLDSILERKVKEIEQELEDCGLLTLKGKKGKVLNLWYETGKRLGFVMDSSLIAVGDREFVWRAIYDHARKLAPGPISERVKRDPETSHFSYCFKLSQFPWDFVEMAGDWTSWSEFFDRKETRNDPRIIKWLGKKAKESNVQARQNWLRPLTRAIHEELGNKDTTVFSQDELYDSLERLFKKMKDNEQT